MPQFNDSPNKILTVPKEGDYVFTVLECDCKISKGPKTAGSDQYELKLELELPGGGVSTAYENLIDHASTAWKMDCFLKSAGVKLNKGEAFEFRKDKAEANKVKWINPLGLRGWCKVGFDIQKDAQNNATGKKFNRVEVFYTDKPKLEPRVIETEDTPF